MNHPNLSDDINSNLAKMEIDGGVWLEMPKEWATIAYKEAQEKGNVLQPGKTIVVKTKNTLYRIEKRAMREYYISGNAQSCPEPVRANINGSTWGGSMLQMGWIGRGMNLEFSLPDHGTITTTPIEEIIEQPRYGAKEK